MDLTLTVAIERIKTAGESIFKLLPAFLQNYLSTSSKWAKILYGLGFSVGALAILRIVYFKWHQKRNSLPPGPMGLPFLGSMIYAADQLYFNKELLASYGPLTTYHMGYMSSISINDPVVARQVYSSKNSKVTSDSYFGVEYQSKEKNINQSFGALNGQHWSRRRGIIHSLIGKDYLNSQFIENGVKNALTTLIFPQIDKIINEKQDQGRVFLICCLLRCLYSSFF